MPVLVSCRLILQAADSTLPPNNPPASGVYPNRVLNWVPPELAPLVTSGSYQHTISSFDAYSCQSLANQMAQGLGSAWSVESSVYSSGSIEQSGKWVTGSGYSFRILNGGTVYEKPMGNVATYCKCSFLMFVEKLATV